MDAQIVLGFEGKAYHARDFYCSQILANILGGGMSSRLFQEVREIAACAIRSMPSIGAFPTPASSASMPRPAARTCRSWCPSSSMSCASRR
jgi:hypothetical protein